MSIGIIGAGAIGSSIARILARASMPATIANRRGPDSLKALADELNPWIKIGSREDAARSDIVFVAVNWSKLKDALQGLAPWDGRIVVDTNNSIEAPSFKAAELHGRTSSEIVADMVQGARVVKAFNHLQPQILAGDPRAEGGQRVLFYSGDDGPAKTDVARIIDRLGFFGIDLGSLAVGSRLVQFPGGPLPGLNLVRFE